MKKLMTMISLVLATQAFGGDLEEQLKNNIGYSQPDLAYLLDSGTVVDSRVMATNSCGLFYNPFLSPQLCDGRTFCIAQPTGQFLRGEKSDNLDEILSIFRANCNVMMPMQNSPEAIKTQIRMRNPRFAPLMDFGQIVNYRVLSSVDCGLFYNPDHLPQVNRGLTFGIARPNGQVLRNEVSDNLDQILSFFMSRCRMQPAVYMQTPEGLKATIGVQFPQFEGLLDWGTSLNYRVMASSTCGLFYNHDRNPQVNNGRLFGIAQPTGQYLRGEVGDSLDQILMLFQRGCKMDRFPPAGEPAGQASLYARRYVSIYHRDLARFLDRFPTRGRVMATGSCGLFVNDLRDPRMCDGKMSCIARPDGTYLGQTNVSFNYIENTLQRFREICSVGEPAPVKFLQAQGSLVWGRHSPDPRFLDLIERMSFFFAGSSVEQIRADCQVQLKTVNAADFVRSLGFQGAPETALRPDISVEDACNRIAMSAQ